MATEADMRAFGASDGACIKYPGAGQAKERAAYCEGAADCTGTSVIMRLADVAEAVASQAGVGGCETAGAIISYLAKHPEQVSDFMEYGAGFLIDTAPADLWGNGRLTFQRKGDAKVLTPQDLRISGVVRDLANPKP